MARRTPEQEMSARTRRGFLVMGAGAVAAWGGWHWLRTGADAGGIPSGFRRVLGLDEKVTKGVLFSDRHLAPVFPASAAREVRPNGDIGLDDDANDDDWKVSLTPYGGQAARGLTLADVRALPKAGNTTEFKCIEGWSTVVNWGGVRFSDVIAAYAPGSEKARFVALKTPNEEYYVGLDMPSALHPQTLLCHEMNGRPLADEHGSPLRLVIPVKYGIKNIKRIGSIAFSDQRPPDYWAERGYDYYAAL